MLLRLGQVRVNLRSESAVVNAGWRYTFTGAPDHSRSDPLSEELTLTLQLVDAVSPPSSHPYYQDPQGIVNAYQAVNGGVVLHFLHGAMVHVDPDQAVATGVVTTGIVHDGQLEDVTYVSLAPLLRRRGQYLLHASAVGSSAGAVLFAGPSYSGKTTTGLAMVLAGWKQLASDVVILARSGAGIVAHPTPGYVGVRPNTFELLPGLHQLSAVSEATESLTQEGRLLVNAEHWGTPTPVRAVCFPRVTAEMDSSLEALGPSLTLAHLMEHSVDRWDASALPEHMAFLTALSRQTSHYRLFLGAKLKQLPYLLQSAL